MSRFDRFCLWAGRMLLCYIVLVLTVVLTEKYLLVHP
jgi:hypothetical protein